MTDTCDIHTCTCHLSPPCSACVDCDNGDCPGTYEPEDTFILEGSVPQRDTKCRGRGWYHDGSEQQEAAEQGRSPKPCPHCSA